MNSKKSPIASSNPKIHFFGGTKEVDGVCYLVECGDEKILIDCGLHQSSESSHLNYEPFSFNPSEISAVIITHGHIDHTGRLPLLYKNGFRGQVYSTPPTRDVSDLLLLDAQHLLMEEAEREKKNVLYSLEDLQKVMNDWKVAEYHTETRISSKFSFVFYNAGHILGSAIVMLKIRKSPQKEIRVVFSGDLGNPQNMLLPEADVLTEGDYCLIESTYGDRLHEKPDKRKDMLEDAIEETVRNGGVAMIPAFAMERTQELMFELDELVSYHRIPQIPVFIDSPLAIRLTGVYEKYLTYLRLEAFKMVESGTDFFNFPGLNFTLTTEESKTINNVPAPKIIVAGAGSSQGGRILHHEKRYLPDPNSTLLIVGYQMAGSLGRRLLEGEKLVKIHGERVQVKAQIRQISAYSAHADQGMLLSWIKPMRFNLKKAFVVQGEEQSSNVLAQKMRDLCTIAAEVPNYQDVVELE
jgi:metallo-beta-lactamase family protein